MNLIEKVAQFAGFSVETTLRLSHKAPHVYKRYTIPKPNGGRRTIFQPSGDTKAIQYALIELLLAQLPIHHIAYGYKRDLGSPLKAMAEKHKCYSYSVRVDFRDFFYCFHPDSLLRTLTENEVPLTAEELTFISNALFIKHKGVLKLAIGAPSSPFVTNAVMHALDELFLNLAKELDPNSTITRYADDLVISSNSRDVCRSFPNRIKSLLIETNSPSLVLNESKTRFMSRAGRRVIVGMTITPSGTVTIGRKRKRFVRHLLHQHKLGLLDEDVRKQLRGYLAFISDVEPNFLNQLAMKYSADTLYKAMHN